MFAEMTMAEREAKEVQKRREGFSKWLEQPATKMMMSMIPPGEHPDAMKTLLQSTYEQGWSNGSGACTGDFLEAILKGMDNDKRERG